jgi:hypothetical protein
MKNFRATPIRGPQRAMDRPGSATSGSWSPGMVLHGVLRADGNAEIKRNSITVVFLNTHTHIQNIYFRFTIYTLTVWYCSNGVLKTKKTKKRKEKDITIFND